jgi:hypothetical protein
MQGGRRRAAGEGGGDDEGQSDARRDERCVGMCVLPLVLRLSRDGSDLCPPPPVPHIASDDTSAPVLPADNAARTQARSSAPPVNGAGSTSPSPMGPRASGSSVPIWRLPAAERSVSRRSTASSRRRRCARPRTSSQRSSSPSQRAPSSRSRRSRRSRTGGCAAESRSLRDGSR